MGIEQQTGVMIGTFEPLDLGHMRDILYACGQVKHLHIFIMPHPNPNPNFSINLKDKARWLTMALADLPFIQVHLLPEGQCFADIFNEISTFQQALTPLNLTKDAGENSKNLLSEKPIVFVQHDYALLEAEGFKDSLNTVRLQALPVQADFDSHSRALIAANPAKYWHIIHPQARGDYTKTVAIVGGESSGKTTLVHKLVNYYGANYALEMGRIFVTTDLGGKELGMQYDDYPLMALDHANAIRHAKRFAPAPVTIVDTDFVTTQAFCEEYEGRTHPFLAACIDEFHTDFTILLDNNTPWVADGMRTLGQAEQRSRFESRLNAIFAEHNIMPFVIDDPDYHQRFLQAVAFIDKHIFGIV